MNRGRLYTPKSAQDKTSHIFDYVNWEAANEKKFGGLFAYKCDTWPTVKDPVIRGMEALESGILDTGIVYSESFIN